MKLCPLSLDGRHAPDDDSELFFHKHCPETAQRGDKEGRCASCIRAAFNTGAALQQQPATQHASDGGSGDVGGDQPADQEAGAHEAAEPDYGDIDGVTTEVRTNQCISMELYENLWLSLFLTSWLQSVKDNLW